MRQRLEQKTLVDRIREGSRSSRSRRLWLYVLVLAAIGSALMLVKPSRRDGPVIAQPSASRPQFAIAGVADKSTRQVERRVLVVLVQPGLPNDTLLAALNWAIYEVLDQQNRADRRFVRVVWAYAVEDTLRSLSRWRAMAIWSDPALAEQSRPAHSGGDALWRDGIEYDFTNPVVPRGADSLPSPWGGGRQTQ